MGRLKYCGNCNPEIDPKKIRNVLKKIALNLDNNVLICVNGCQRMCITKKIKPESTQKIIHIIAKEIYEQKNNDTDNGGKQ